jgi:hypothetical protein
MMNKFGIFVLVLMVAFCVSAWTTWPSSDSSKRFGVATTTGALIGTGLTGLHKGAKYISIAEIGPATGITFLYIKSPSIDTADNTATLLVGPGGIYDSRFAKGIDSLSVTVIGAGGAVLAIETSN